MEAVAAVKPTSTSFIAKQLAKQQESKPISWPEFQRRYLSREDGFKYEWVKGKIEKTTRSMDQSQYQVLRNLRNLFTTLLLSKRISGGMESEIDTFFLEDVHRRPDVSYFSKQQENNMAKGQQQIPLFVIEIISTNDQINRVHKKMQNYRDAGVQVVWQIFPNLSEIHVYRGPHLNQMNVCKGEDRCLAAPVLPDFAMSAMDVFKLPEEEEEL